MPELWGDMEPQRNTVPNVMRSIIKCAAIALACTVGLVAGIAAFAYFIIALTFVMSPGWAFVIAFGLLIFGSAFWVAWGVNR